MLPTIRYRTSAGLFMRSGAVFVGALLFALVACSSGIYIGYKRLWPVPEIDKIIRAQIGNASFQTDAFGRLLRYPGKTEVQCPVQDKDVAVLLVAGQSNAGNYQGQRHQAVDERVINFSEGRCFVAGSPLLGADGRLGESWTLLGNKLVEQDVYKRVVLIPASVGASAMHRWARDGDLNHMLLGVTGGVKPIYGVTAILWDQGSTDMALHTSEAQYWSDLKSLIASLRADGITAPFYITRASVTLDRDWTPHNPIARAQRSLVDGISILAGPDTDASVTAWDRYDGLHFSASGQEKFADDWVRLLRRLKGAE